MAEYAGILIRISDENRSERVQNRCHEGGEFTDTFSASDWRFMEKEVILLSFDTGIVEYLCLLERGNRVATDKVRVTCRHFVDLNRINTEEVDGAWKQRFSPIGTEGGGRFSAEGWAHTIKSVKKLRPDLVDDIDSLLARRSDSGSRITGAGAEQLAQERDALGVALDIFDPRHELREKVLAGYIPPESETAPFLKGVDSVRVTEQQMLAHDSGVLGGLAGEVETSFSKSFDGPQGKLDVLYLNQTAVESALGVDLLYYHHRFEAYTLVQYKRMRRSGLGSEWKFYPNSDSNFQSELERMRHFAKKQNGSVLAQGPNGYRLSNEGMFFKFCPTDQPSLSGGDLIKGLYLPLDYTERLLADDCTNGERDGKVLSYDNTIRHFSNTEFTSLVQKGWIGTSGLSTDDVTKLVRAALDGNRAVIHAWSKA